MLPSSFEISMGGSRSVSRSQARVRKLRGGTGQEEHRRNPLAKARQIDLEAVQVEWCPMP